MANLGSFKINTEGEWEDFETLTELTLVDETIYLLQVQNICAFCAKASEPEATEKGFVINFNVPFEYTHDDTNTLYIKTYDRQPVEVNIAN